MINGSLSCNTLTLFMKYQNIFENRLYKFKMHIVISNTINKKKTQRGKTKKSREEKKQNILKKNSIYQKEGRKEDQRVSRKTEKEHQYFVLNPNTENNYKNISG